jgi:hypothetical protein
VVEIAKLEQFEDELRKLPPLDLAVSHHFADGVYARCMYIPAGVVSTGRIHKTEHLISCIKGKGVLVTQNGRFSFEAGNVITVPAETKKAFIAEEDSILMNVHRNDDNKHDIEDIENDLTYPIDYRRSLVKEEVECLSEQ